MSVARRGRHFSRAIKKVVGEATDSHVKAVKASLADASAKMAGSA